MSSKKFFLKKEEWSKRKHLILEYYMQPAFYKLRSISSDNRVILLDACAGRGQYESGDEGSPLITGKFAEKVAPDFIVINIEENEEYYNELSKVTGHLVKSKIVHNINGTFQNNIEKVLRFAKHSPLLVFLDPFTFTEFAIKDIRPLLARESATEICGIFFANEVRRVLYALLSPKIHRYDKHRDGMSSTLTRVFGEGWNVLMDEEPIQTTTIMQFFGDKILLESNKYKLKPAYFAFKPIYEKKDKNRDPKNIKYYFVYWTRHIEGVLLMNDAFAKEEEVLNKMTDDEIALVALKKSGGQISLFEQQDQDDDEHARKEFLRLCDSILEIGNQRNVKIWTRRDLINRSIIHNFGKFRRTLHRRAIKYLLESPASKIEVAGENKNMINDDTVLRFK